MIDGAMDSPNLTQATQGTQDVMDPRRMGRNNSGLSSEDVADVICVLHPATPAAFALVAETAQRTPQHILQDVESRGYAHQATPSMLEEEETFILDGNRAYQALDLAFRFSSRTVSPHEGFLFGRNTKLCDIAVQADVHKRVSNVHFAIYMNESGVLMIKDMSSNGTLVDDFVLRGRGHTYQKTRMLNNGSVIQILSHSQEEVLKFVVQIPSRQGFELEYEQKFCEYMTRLASAKRQHRLNGGDDLALIAKLGNAHQEAANAVAKAPLVRNQHGMHWSGGDKYNIVGQIGKGAFAQVYQLATKHDGQLYAAKELEKRRFMKNGILDRKLENEMLIMQSVNHPSIVQYHEYQDIANHLYIIMEFVPHGDLQQYLVANGPLPELMAKQMATQVFDALDYLHNNRITHRDIKPDNILLASLEADNFVIKLSDFGLSKVVKDNDTFLKTFCGTLLYCAPEVFPHYDAHVGVKGTKRPRKPPPPAPSSSKLHSYSQAVDIWSFGAVLWYALCQKPPFEGVADNTGRGMFDKIMMTPLETNDLATQGVSNEAVALLVQMLNTDPAERPSAEYCLRHEWFGDRPPPVPRQPESGLVAIAEEVEAEERAGAEPNVAALSLREEHRSQNSDEISFNSSDMNFFDPRKSKRFKTNGMDYRDADEELVDSSLELYQSIPIMHDKGDQQQEKRSSAQKPPKLFGEISRSDLQSAPPGNATSNLVSGEVDSMRSEERGDAKGGNSRKSQERSAQPCGASPSLLGAESMVRDMNMDSPYGDISDEGEDDEAGPPQTPATANAPGQASISNEGSEPKPEETPKPGQTIQFKRQISIPLPPSFYYDPSDPSTHNLEYASKVSGRDYATESSSKPKGASLPPTMTNSKSSEAADETTAATAPGYEALASANGASASQMALGRLVSTPDSFADITIELKDRYTSFGRAADCTNAYPDETETRVPRNAISIFFYGGGIQDVPSGGDITALPGLYCGIFTHSSVGLRVNGVQLNKGKPGKTPFGKLHTGDEIEVWPANAGKAGLTFVAEINYGQGKKRRSKNSAAFKVEQEHCLSKSKARDVDTAAGAEENS